MRLIDVDFIPWQECLDTNGYAEPLDKVIAVIQNMPTVEAEPVKHGRWNTVVHSNNHTTYYCPKCGSIFNKGCADLGEYNYCPNCGAKMDLDEVEE